MKHMFWGCLLLITLSVYAEEAEKENFDRLFTSHAERQKLDDLRRKGLIFQKPSVEAITEGENKPLNPKRPLKVSGIVLRADGKAQVWLSDKPLYTSLKDLNLARNKSSDLHVPLPDKKISAKPGQVIENGKVKEAYYFVNHQASASSQSSTPDISISSAASSVSSAQEGNHAQSSVSH